MTAQMKKPAGQRAIPEQHTRHVNTSTVPVDGLPMLDLTEARELISNFPCCFLYNLGETRADGTESPGKDPIGGGWQKRPQRPSAYAGRGIGVICGPVPGFDARPVYGLDFDIRHDAPAEAMRDWLATWLVEKGKQGQALERVGKAPKFLVPFVLADNATMKKYTGERLYPAGLDIMTDDEKTQLEILGAGNQFVAYHLHPDTGKPYTWDAFGEAGFIDQLHMVAPDDLLELTQADLEEIKQAFARIMRESGLESAQEIRKRQAPPKPPAKFSAAPNPHRTPGERVAEILSHLPNTGWDYESDTGEPTYIGVMMAVHDATDGAGFDAFRQWSAQSGKEKESEDRRKWASLTPGKGVTLGSLVKWAQDYGTLPLPKGEDAPPADAAKTPEEVAAALDALDIPEPERPGAFPIPESCKRFFAVRMGLDMARATEMPEATAVMTALGALSGVLSIAFCTGYADGSRLPVGLYTVAEQPPGAAKSRLLNSFASPWLRKVKQYNAERMKEAEENGKKARLLPLPFSNATPEAIEQAMTKDDTGNFWLQSAEQGAIRMLFGDGVKDRPKNFDLALKGFNGEFHSSARVTRDKLLKEVYGAITVLAQAGSIRTILSNSDGDGLAERFLFVAEPHNLGRRTHDAKPPDAFMRADLEQAMSAVMRLYQTIPEEKRGELGYLHYLGFSDTAREMIRQHKIRIEPKLAQHADNGEMVLTAMLSKSDMQAMKLAAVMYLSDRLAEDKPYSDRIPDEYLTAGLELSMTLMKHIEAVLISMERIGPEAAREAIRRQFDRRPERTVREIVQNVKKVKPFRDNPSPSAYAKRIITGMVNRGELIQVGNRLQLG